MKKKLRLLSLFTALICAVSTAACSANGNNEEDYVGKTVVNIVSINKGYGVQWLKDVAAIFEQQHENVKVKISVVYDDSVIKNNLESGRKYCDYDLMFTGAGTMSKTNFVADLTDVYDSTLPGKTQTIGESMDQTLKAAFAENGTTPTKYYYMPWTAGIDGFLVNYEAAAKLFGEGWENTYKLRTTNEVLAFAAAIKAKGANAFGHCADTHYYHFLYETWWAQYEGLQGISDYYNGIYYDAFGEKQIGPEVCLQQGRLESLKVMESIFSNGYSDPRSNGNTFEVTQTYFMLGEFVMFSNGDWNNLEMSKSFPNTDIRFYKTPVISSLGTKLGISEAQLIEVIDYIDGASSQKPAVSDEIIETIRESRSLIHTYASAHSMAIPEYSDHIDLAKEFIKLLISDVGQAAYAKATGGLTLGYGYDLEKFDGYDSLSKFAKTRWEVQKNSNYYLMIDSKFGSVGLTAFKCRDIAPLPVALSRDYDRKTAQYLYEYDYNYWNGQNWSTLVTLANSKIN